jgi:multidrug resistance efflux pump
VDEAQAQLVQELAQRDNVRKQAARVIELVRVYATSKGDQARSELGTAEAQVQRAQASLEQARQALGPKGADNPQIREALAALEQARLDLTRTTLLAPGDGVVSNLQLNIGQFASAGQPALTFLDARLVWLQAFLRENSRTPARKAGLSPWEGKIPRDADCPLEGGGFEPSVPLL